MYAIRVAAQARKFTGSFPVGAFVFVPKSPVTSSNCEAARADAAVDGAVDDDVDDDVDPEPVAAPAVVDADLELFSACRIILAAVWVDSALPNKPSASCN